MVNRCCLCKSDGESVDHLILHCETASALWHAIFSHFGLSWVMSNGVADLFACWWTGGHPQSAIVWNMIPFALCGVYGGKEMQVALSTLEELTSFFFFYSFHLDNSLVSSISD